MTEALFLGLDASTQGLKATLVAEDAPGTVVHHAAVNYDRDLPHFRTSGGMHKNGSTVTSPVLMWLEALDLLLARLRADEQPSVVLGTQILTCGHRALSGSGQQHVRFTGRRVRL